LGAERRGEKMGSGREEWEGKGKGQEEEKRKVAQNKKTLSTKRRESEEKEKGQQDNDDNTHTTFLVLYGGKTFLSLHSFPPLLFLFPRTPPPCSTEI
jgi:hypothetical protein